jgi:hypothetical protein
MHVKNSAFGYIYSEWLLDYMTRFNMDTDGLNDVMAHTDIEGIMAAVTDYCREHPTESYGHAVGFVVGLYFLEHKGELIKP